MHIRTLRWLVVVYAQSGSAGDVGQYSSVTIGADGLPLISYRDLPNGDLKVAHCSAILNLA